MKASLSVVDDASRVATQGGLGRGLAGSELGAVSRFSGARGIGSFRLTADDLASMERVMQEGQLGRATFVKEAGQAVRRYLPTRAGNFEINSVKGVGYVAEIGSRPRAFVALTDFDRRAITLFDDAIRLDARALGVSYRELRVRTLLHELTHESRGYVGLADEFEEAIASASAWGFPIPLG